MDFVFLRIQLDKIEDNNNINEESGGKLGELVLRNCIKFQKFCGLNC